MMLEAAARSGLMGVTTGQMHVGQDGMLRGPVIVIQTANPQYIPTFLDIAAQAA